MVVFLVVIIRLPPRATRAYTLLPNTALFRSAGPADAPAARPQLAGARDAERAGDPQPLRITAPRRLRHGPRRAAGALLVSGRAPAAQAGPPSFRSMRPPARRGPRRFGRCRGHSAHRPLGATRRLAATHKHPTTNAHPT